MKIVVKTWDKDIYILDGYESAEAAERKLSQGKKAKMPTGTILRTSAIRAVMPYNDYIYQQKQKQNHSRNEYIGRDGYWHNEKGKARKANLDNLNGNKTKRIKEKEQIDKIEE